MRLLQDVELTQLIQQGNLVQGVADLDRQVKGCSVDLTIGSIFLPGAEKDALGAVGSPRREISLGQGATAVVRTKELIALGLDLAGVAFPASNVSLAGLLMTNPGHIDPGYHGHLHVTVINMGKDPYCLRPGGRLMRSLFIKFEEPAKKSYLGGSNPIDEELLSRLSSDFLDVEDRARKVAERAVAKADFVSRALQIAVPVVVAIIGIYGTWVAASGKFDERLGRLESRVPANLNERMTKVETLAPVARELQELELVTIKKLEARMARLEMEQRAKVPPAK